MPESLKLKREKTLESLVKPRKAQRKIAYYYYYYHYKKYYTTRVIKNERFRRYENIYFAGNFA